VRAHKKNKGLRKAKNGERKTAYTNRNTDKIWGGGGKKRKIGDQEAGEASHHKF
jgi:hypothetical protein